MYCISRSANLTLPIRGGRTEYHPVTGAAIRVHPALSVQFQHAGSVPDFAREAVTQLASWGNGMGIGEDPFSRCGSLDTEIEAERQGWNAEELAVVEEALRNSSSNGVEYVIASEAAAPKPWPTYDNIDGADEDVAYTISRKVVEDGWNPRDVLKYEAENANRVLVIRALEAVAAEQDADVVGVISA